MEKCNIFIFRGKCTFFLKIYSRISKNKIYSWNKCRSIKKIPYSHSCSFFSNKEKARRIFNNYFENNMPNKECLSTQYIKKMLISDFDEYYSFTAQVLQMNKKIYKIIGAGIFKNIYDNRKIKTSYFLIFGYTVAIVKMSLVFLRLYLLCYMQKSSIKVGDVVYLRRKALPDAFLNSHKFFIKNKVSFSGVIFDFSNSISKYDLYFLSSFVNSFAALKKAARIVVRSILKDTTTFYALSVSTRQYYNFLRETLYVNTLLELKPKVIYGSLTDRPYGVLLYKHKKPFQKICMHSDGFYFDPLPGPEYVYADVFYGMNELDCNNINRHGGGILKIIDAGFYRKTIRAKSKGVHKDLKRLIFEFEHIVVITLATVRVNKYFPIDLAYFKDFILEIIEQTSVFDKSLFILKGKKGEIELIPDEYAKFLSQKENVYIVPCDVPYLLEYNHYEDLIDYADLVVSMHYASMTVWQSIASEIPTIGYNYCNDITEFSNSPYFIVNKGGLLQAIKYWKGLDECTKKHFFQNIKGKANLHRKDALHDMYSSLSSMVG